LLACWRIGISELIVGRPVTERTLIISLARKATSALFFALVTWGVFSGLRTSALVNDPGRGVFARHNTEHIPNLTSNEADDDCSPSTLNQASDEDTDLADVVIVATRAESSPIITRCTACNAVPIIRIPLAPNADHLIEFPGTPPPVLL
jgi:hypothetical protein